MGGLSCLFSHPSSYSNPGIDARTARTADVVAETAICQQLIEECQAGLPYSIASPTSFPDPGIDARTALTPGNSAETTICSH